ncbi:MAG: zf-HC2 domain-containing protein, partial [Pyrinomonadaceae bacterium]
MNCSDCKGLIGALMDNELEQTQAAAVREHLAFCAECAVVCEDLTSIVDACKNDASEIVPPNSKALWLRINNMIESDVKPAPVLPEPPARRSWGVSILRFSAAVLVIAVISSTVTYFALKNYIANAPTKSTSISPSLPPKAISRSA